MRKTELNHFEGLGQNPLKPLTPYRHNPWKKYCEATPGCSLGLGELARRQGNWARARSHLEVAFEGFQAMDYKYGLAATLERLAHLALDEAQFVQAAWLFAAADHLRMSYGMALLSIEQTAHDQAVAAIQELLPEAEYHAAMAGVGEATVQEIVAWVGQVSIDGWAG